MYDQHQKFSSLSHVAVGKKTILRVVKGDNLISHSPISYTRNLETHFLQNNLQTVVV